MENRDDRQRDIEQHTGRPAPDRAHVAGGPSPLTEVDEMALHAPKSEWQERNAPAAGDPASEAELNGLSLLGGSDARGGGSIPGVSDPVRDGSAGPRERADAGINPAGAGGRKNPPQIQRMEADDIADAITYVVTRPRHVALNEVLIRPTQQVR